MELSRPDPPLEDDVVQLRPWKQADIPAIVAACNDPEISRWIPLIPSPYTEEHARAFVSGTSEDYSLAITLDGAVVGAIGMGLNEPGYRGRIGYWVAAPVRGAGICTRALRLLSNWALAELELRRLELITDPANHASQRVAEKVGFCREGMLRSYLLDRDGSLGDAVMFSLLPGELVE